MSDRRVLTRRFSNFWSGVWEAERDILLPQVRYATNDSWEEITALAGPNGFPLLHHADYGSGRLFVLTVPDNFADLYALPAPALDHIRRVVTKGLPVRLQGPSQVSLFAYDNDTYVVHSFLDRMGVVELVADGRDVTLVDLQTGAVLPGQPRGEETVFPVFLQPHQHRAFERRKAAAAAGASARAFAVNQKLGRAVNIIGYDPIWQDRAKGRFKAGYFAKIREAGFTAVRVNLHPFRHMDPADRARPEAVVARHARLGGEGRPRRPPGRDPRHARVPRDGRGPRGPQGGVALVLAAGGAALQGRARRRRLRAAERAVRQADAGAVERVPEGGPGRRPRHEPDARGDRRRRQLELDRRPADARPARGRPQPDRHRPLLHADGVHPPGRAVGRRSTRTARASLWTGTDQERRRIELDFARAQQWAVAHDRPVHLGEFGAYDKADMDSRARYTAAVARTAERLGWSWAYWQFDSDFVVYDVERDAWVEPLRKALVP